MLLNPSLLSTVSLPSSKAFFRQFIPLRHPYHLQLLCLDSSQKFHLLQLDYNVSPLSLSLLKQNYLESHTPVYKASTFSPSESLGQFLVVSSQNNPIKFYSLENQEEDPQPELIHSYPLYSEDRLKLQSPLTVGFNNNLLYCGLTSEIVRLRLDQSGTVQGSPERYSPMKKSSKKRKWMYSCCDFLDNLSVFGTYEPPAIILGDERMRRSLQVLVDQDMVHTHGIYQVSLINQYMLLSSARCEQNVILWDLRMTHKYMDQLQTQFMKGYPEEFKDFQESKLPTEESSSSFSIVQYYTQSLSHQHFKFSLLDRFDQMLMAKGGSDGCIALYNIGTGQCKAYFQGHQAPVGDVVLSAHPFDKSKLLLMSCSGTRSFNSPALRTETGLGQDSLEEEEEEEGVAESSIKLRELNKN